MTSASRTLSSHGAALGLVIAVAAVGGCQLLLPSGDDDGQSSTGAQGGASSSTGASTSTKTSSSDSSSASGDSTATTATGSTSHSSVSSSSTGMQGCAPALVACDGISTLSLPKLCPTQVACDNDLACKQYCSAIFSLCPEQYLTPEVCCEVCGHLKGQGEASQCCHVGALNDIAAGNGTSTSCTVAGPFGSDSMVSNACSTQAANLCTIYEAACATQAMTCTKSSCKNALSGRDAVIYVAGSDPTTTMPHLMDLLLGSDPNKCELAAAELCGAM